MKHLVIVLLALSACNDKRADQPATGRVNASKVEAKRGASAEAFCDVYFAGDTGPKLTVPALVGGTLDEHSEAMEGGGPAASANRPGGDGAAGPRGNVAPSGWRWINVWATWCKPCIEEMPRLVRWRDKLAAAGKQVDLAFVSVDESDEDLAAYRKLHPDTPASPRLADPEKQAAWYAALGLDGAPPIPIHVFVTPAGHVRCARAGGVREQDYAGVERVFAP